MKRAAPHTPTSLLRRGLSPGFAGRASAPRASACTKGLRLPPSRCKSNSRGMCAWSSSDAGGHSSLKARFP
eukprot:6521842-Alexandrium_andersonii.AAC.1